MSNTSVTLHQEDRLRLAEIENALGLMGAPAGRRGRRSQIIRAAIAELHRVVTTGDLWVGTGGWRGWRITAAHAACSHGDPVLVRPDGTALGPGDL